MNAGTGLIRSHGPATAKPPQPTRATHRAGKSKAIVNFVTQRPQLKPSVSVSLIAALIVFIGFVDFDTTAYIAFRAFYYVPIALAVSWFGWKAGAVASVCSVIVWVIGDYQANSPFIRGPAYIAVWNVAITLITFLIMVWTLHALFSLHREMERRVQDRTRSLEAALATQERLRRELVEVGSRERNVVGRELHDGLCQHLAATAFAAQVHADRLTRVDSAEAENARSLVTMTQEAITQSRQVASGLLLSGITAQTLLAELNDFAATVSRQGTVACRFEHAGKPRLPDAEVAVQLFRIAQEAVRNAVKHGSPSEIRVVLSGDDRHLELSITDDGIGIPPVERREFGMGLEIMAHRAGAIGASFSVMALPAGGTRVTCKRTEPA